MLLNVLRAQRDQDLPTFAASIGISRATLARIEAAERDQSRHPMTLRAMVRLAESVSKVAGERVTAEDLEGIMVARPRPGRPKRSKE